MYLCIFKHGCMKRINNIHVYAFMHVYLLYKNEHIYVIVLTSVLLDITSPVAGIQNITYNIFDNTSQVFIRRGDVALVSRRDSLTLNNKRRKRVKLLFL